MSPEHMIPKVESYKTMRQNRMEIREKLELLKQKPLKTIVEEEQRYVNLPSEKEEIFHDFRLHHECVGQGWFHITSS